MNRLKENPYCRALIKINGESDLSATRRDKIFLSFPFPPPPPLPIFWPLNGEKGKVQARPMNNFNEIFIAVVNSRGPGIRQLLGARNRNLSRSLSVEKLSKETFAT